MVNSALQKIQQRAKKIRTKNMSWIQAIKTASTQLKREGKIGDAKKVGRIKRRNPRKTGMTSKSKRRKVGAIKIIEKGETKKTPIKKTYMVNRNKRGEYKKFSVIGRVDSLALQQLNSQVKLLRDVEGKKEATKKRISLERDKRIKIEMKKELLSIDILIGIIKKNIRLIKGRVK